MGVNKTTIAFPLGFDKYLIIEIGEENIVLMVVEAQGKRVYLQKFPYKNQSIHGLVKGKTYRWSVMGMDPSHLGSQLSRQMLRYRDFEVIRRCSSRRGTSQS